MSNTNTRTHGRDEDLCRRWSEAWGLPVPAKISREMLEKSLAYKEREQQGLGLTPEQLRRLDDLVAEYKRNPDKFTQKSKIKPGTRLVKTWQGQRHVVLVREDGYEYLGQPHRSLSAVARLITGARWNGWVFFGVKSNYRGGEE